MATDPFTARRNFGARRFPRIHPFCSSGGLRRSCAALRTLESNSGTSRLLLELISRGRGGQRQQRRRERNDCDLKRRSAPRIILFVFHGSFFCGFVPLQRKNTGTVSEKMASPR